jgi:hypothetical protein
MSVVTIPNLGQLEKIKTLLIVVASPETELTARAHLTEVRLAGKQLDKDIKMMKAPHQAEIKRIDDMVKEWKSMLAERDQALERALLDYGRKVRQAADEANRKAMERYEVKVEKVEAKAIAQGKPIPVVLPPQMVSAPPKSVETEGAKQTVVKRKAWRIPSACGVMPDDCTMEINLDRQIGIPASYFILDTARIGKVVRAGGSIPGIEVFEEESLSIRAT